MINNEKISEYLIYFALFSCIIAWFWHIFECFESGLWGFLIAGAIFFPIGILHGFYLILTSIQ